ncbi:N-acetylmuramoyl-L-alanine amidase [Luteolibacter sp. SL250]|uniref:N-acetylmuramoyl-L-alanine amidase family protein n=1 Tax=Luteolibacter sp. SL250 TaxID=2995170 RepID=UPI00226F6162|nr:N-acetylmuramoyl-L-alanine amidase [Luteolibacter sp. SL250]WAC20171.1 N-acetylmuramoyl-L-alanine amidase [Luteolibacter sp. SL250]
MKTASLAFGWMGALLLSAVTLDARDLGKEWEWEVKRVGETDYIPLGKFGEFYGFGGMERNGAEIRFEVERKIKVSFNVGSKECEFNKVKIILNREIMEDGGEVFLSREDLSRLIDPILRPDQIGGPGVPRTVILDPTGGGDAALHAWEIAGKTKTKLEERGIKVIMTRGEEKAIAVEERVGAANEVQEPAVFVSITFLDEKDGPKGMRTSVLTPPAEEAADGGGDNPRLGAALGISIHGIVLFNLRENTQDNGLSSSRDSGLAGLRHPAITLTAANLADEYEARLAANEKFQDAVATGIATGIFKYQFGISRKRE